ncbi:hypothetical protein M0R45_032738 [Rubus argutus]|uniref:Pentatricopeptide repeat-containing protein n=1 Tax=Rubus argutus TaxID=59490 RepID=A0AAW1WIJ9_RUBAR
MEENGCSRVLKSTMPFYMVWPKHNQLGEVKKVCKKMVNQGLVSNVITYTSLIDGLCKNGSTDLAFRIFHEMRERDCLPNLYTYSSLIFGLCQEGKADDERLLEEMEREGLVPDLVTFTMLIDGLYYAR